MTPTSMDRSRSTKVYGWLGSCYATSTRWESQLDVNCSTPSGGPKSPFTCLLFQRGSRTDSKLTDLQPPIHRRPHRMGCHWRTDNRIPTPSRTGVRLSIPHRLQERHRRVRRGRDRCYAICSSPTLFHGYKLSGNGEYRQDVREQRYPHHPPRRDWRTKLLVSCYGRSLEQLRWLMLVGRQLRSRSTGSDRHAQKEPQSHSNLDGRLFSWELLEEPLEPAESRCGSGRADCRRGDGHRWRHVSYARLSGGCS